MHVHRHLKAVILFLSLLLLTVWVAPFPHVQTVTAQDDPAAQIEALAEAVHIQNFRSSRSTEWIGGDLGLQGREYSGVNVGTQFSNWRVENIYDETIDYTLADLERPILVNIWASWCGPCVFEFPFLTDYAQRENLNFDLWFLNASDTNKSAAIRFLNGQDRNINALYDPNNSFSDALGSRFLPTTVLINTDGTLVAAHAGIVTESVMDFFNAVAAAPGVGSFDGSNYEIDLVELLQPIDAATATAVTFGQQAAGVIDDENFRRDYAFTGEANQSIGVRVTYTSGDISLYAALISPSGELIEQSSESESDAAGFALNFELPEDGEYVLIISRFLEDEGFGEGSFNILVNDPSAEPAVAGPNDTLILTPGSTSGGVLTFERQQEAYVMELEAGQTLTFTLTHDLPEEQVNLQVRQGQTRLVPYTRSENGELTYEATVEESGTYSVYVARSSSSRAGPITFSLTVVTGDDDPEGPDERPAAGVPQRLNYGDVVTGEITNDVFEQRYEFEGTEGDVVNITTEADLEAGSLDSTLTLLDPNGDILAENDDIDFTTTNSALTDVNLTATGVYTIVVSRFLGADGFTEGPYTLTLTATETATPSETDDTDSNTDTTSEAEVLEIGAVVTGTIDTEMPEQVYTFDGTAGTVVTLRTTTLTGNLDTILTLRDPDGNDVVSNDDADFTTRDSLIDGLELPVDGTYTVVVGRFEDTAGEFELTFSAAQDTTVPDDTMASDNSIVYGDVVSGDINDDNVSQEFTFEGAAGDVVTLLAYATSGDVDTVLTLAGPDGTLIAENDDADFSTTSSAILDQPLPTDGTYTVTVTRFEGVNGQTSGTFELSITATAAVPNNTDDTAIDTDTTAIGEVVMGTINDETPEVRFTFDGVAGDIVTIQMVATSGNLDTSLFVLDENGDNIARNDDADFTTTDSLIEQFELPNDGTYTILATRFLGVDGTSSGEFELTIIINDDAVSPDDTDTTGATEPDDSDTSTDVSTNSLMYGESVTNTISDETFAYTYTFEAAAGDVISITATGAENGLDTLLILQNPDGEEIARNDDAELGTTDSALPAIELESTGTYTITLTRFREADGLSSGEFTLTLEFVENRRTDDTDTDSDGTDAADVQTLNDGDQVTGTIDSNNYEFRFDLDGTAGDVINLELRADESDLDTLLQVLSPDGNVLAENDDEDFISTDSVLTGLQLPEDGTYTVVVTRFNGADGLSEGDFVLTVTFGESVGVDTDTTDDTDTDADVDDTDTDNIDVDTVTAIAIGDTVQGEITNSNFEDEYTFEASAGAAVTIEVFATSGDLDTLLELYDPNGDLIAANDDIDLFEGNYNSALTNIRLGEGTYTILVTRFEGNVGASTGSYELSLTQSDSLDAVEATAIEYGTSIDGTITNENNEALYTFMGAAGDEITIEMTAAESLDTLLILLGPDNAEVAFNDDFDAEAGFDAAIVDFILPESGEYTIIATRYEGGGAASEGDYTLTLSATGVEPMPDTDTDTDTPDTPEDDTTTSPDDTDTADDAVPATTEGQVLNVDVPVAGTINDENLEDRFIFVGAEGDVVSISLQATAGNLDTYLSLLDENGVEIAFNDDNIKAIGNDSLILNFKLPTDGTYTVVATRYGSFYGRTTGDYELQLSID